MLNGRAFLNDARMHGRGGARGHELPQTTSRVKAAVVDGAENPCIAKIAKPAQSHRSKEYKETSKTQRQVS